MHTYKIILIHNIITPTRTTLFNELYKKAKEENKSFEVWFTQRSEVNRKWNETQEIKKFHFPYIILDGKQIQNSLWRDKHFFHINTNILKKLHDEQPDRIIHAWWAWISAFLACWWAKKNKKVFTLRSWSTEYETSWRRTITLPIVKRLVRNSHDYRSYGTRASEYLVSLWADKEKIYPLYNTVDVEYFIQCAKELKPQKTQLKSRYGIKESKVILFVWQFIKRKWVYELLEWFKMYQDRFWFDTCLLFVGDWPEKKSMKEIIEKIHIKSVYMFDFVPKDILCNFYTMWDMFVLPSHEEVRWLVVNEAMCFGLFILSTKFTWATCDLVDEKLGVVLEQVSPTAIYFGLTNILNNLSSQNRWLIIKKSLEYSIRNVITWLKL